MESSPESLVSEDAVAPTAPDSSPPDSAPVAAAGAAPGRPQRSKLPLVLLALLVPIAIATGVGLCWYMQGGDPITSERAVPSAPVPPEPASPPPPLSFVLASSPAAESAPKGVESAGDPVDRIAAIVAKLPPELLLTSADSAAQTRLIVAGVAERSIDAISRIPRHERWEIKIPPGNTTDSYTRQLDHFKIEIGVIGDAAEIVYLSNLSAPTPVVRKEPAAAEKRLYLIWQRGSMREADEELLARAKLPAKGKVVVHFCPEALETQLVQLEDAHAKEKGYKKIRKTVFGVQPSDISVYRFYVIEQKADDS